MSFATLHTNLVSLIQEITDVGEISSRPKFDFTAYPGIFIAESGNENEYDSTQDNLRTYAFNIWVFEKFTDDASSLDAAYESVRETVDAIIDKLDQQEAPSSDRELAANLGAGKTLTAVVAQPSRFAYDEVEKLIGAQVVVRLRVLVDLTQLS